MILLNLPWPPSVNNYYTHTSKGVYLSKAGRVYTKEVALLASRYKKAFSEQDRLHISIDAFPPDRRKRDLDNLLKASIDALMKAEVFPDDSQIDEIHIRRRDDRLGIVRVLMFKTYAY